MLLPQDLIYQALCLKALVFWVMAQPFTEHFNSNPRGAIDSVAARLAAE